MKNFFQTILDWIQSLFTVIHDTKPPTIPETPVEAQADPYKALTDLIVQENQPFGPSPRTGGKINKISPETASQVAKLLTDSAKEQNFELALAAAWIKGESRFDPGALNPNFQDAKHSNETEQEVFMHTDVGIGQFDGAQLVSLLPGLTWQEQKAKALDPTWAIPEAVKWMKGLLDWAQHQDQIARSVAMPLPYTDYRVLGCEAYNAGRTGTLFRLLKTQPGFKGLFVKNGSLILTKNATLEDIKFTETHVNALTDGNMGYGTGLLARYEQYKKLLG